MKRFLLPFLSVASLIAVAPAKAISFVWNGTSTYQCNGNGNICTVTANNFALSFNGATWSDTTSVNGAPSVGSITLANGASTRTLTNGVLAFTPAGLGGLNQGQAFTLSQNSGNGFFATFYLSSVPTGVGTEIVSITAVGSPSFTTFGNLPSGTDPNPSVFTSAILGVSGPGPLSLIALLPIFNLAKKKRLNRSPLNQVSQV